MEPVRVALKDGSVRRTSATTWESNLSKLDYDNLRRALRVPDMVCACDIVTDAGLVRVRLAQFLQRPAVLWEKMPIDPVAKPAQPSKQQMQVYVDAMAARRFPMAGRTDRTNPATRELEPAQ